MTDTNDTKTLYVVDSKEKGLIPLVFTIPEQSQPIEIEGYTLKWSIEGLKILKYISDQVNPKKLPYSSLRNLLEVHIKNITQIEQDLSLNWKTFQQREQKKVQKFAYLSKIDTISKDEVIKNIRQSLDNWLINYLSPFIEREELDGNLIDQLDEFRDNNSLILIDDFNDQILPWIQEKETGTAKPLNNYHYLLIVNHIARQLAGKEIFIGLGKLKRIIGSSNNAELITEPIKLPNTQGTFSLVLKLEIITFPSLRQSLLKIDVSKRRWLTNLGNPKIRQNKINGYIFSDDHENRVFNYQLLCLNDKKNKSWYWETDKDFEVLQQKLGLSLTNFTGTQIAQGQANTDSCKVLLTFRHGLDGSKEHDINDGVLESDKLEAVNKLTELLENMGFIPFQDIEKVKTKSFPELTIAKIVNPYTLLGAVLEASKDSWNGDLTSDYLSCLEQNKQLDNLLQQYLDIISDSIAFSYQIFPKDNQSKKSKDLSDQTQLIQLLNELNQAALNQLYPDETIQLVIFYEPKFKRDAELVEKVASLLWGNDLEINLSQLPTHTHGYRKNLPYPGLNKKQRLDKRVEAWKPYAEQLKKQNKRTFCLIIAPKFYGNQPDDKVNKPATRKAVSSIAGACVQFMRPMDTTKEGKLKLKDFFQRIQTSLKELLLAHSGYLYDVQGIVNQHFSKTTQPKEIIGFTIVRKQKGRVIGNIDKTFLPIAVRINVETGITELRFCTENYTQGQWLKFSDTLSEISKITPITMGDKPEDRKIYFMKFVNMIISESANANNQPFVIIDSSNCVSLWGWLADVRINPDNINMKVDYYKSLGILHENLQYSWRKQGVRIVRIRRNIAPKILMDKERRLFKSSPNENHDPKKTKSLTPDLTLHTPTSPNSGLFRLITTYQTACSTYLSIRKYRTQYEAKGKSCYRETQINKKTQQKNQAQKPLNELASNPPHIGKWSTPNPVEIVVVLHQDKDIPDHLAKLTESLRFYVGHTDEWVSLPAVIFFERVVRDYISEFTIDDDESESND